jgi:hypothetical protein
MSDAAIRSILRQPDHPRFEEIATDLLLATQDPDEIRRWCDWELLAGAYGRGLRRRIRNRSVRGWYDLLWPARGARRRSPGDRNETPAGRREHMAPLARRLRSLVREGGLSAAEVGRRMRVSRQRVHDLLRGRSDVTVGTLLRFAQAVGATLTIDFTAAEG